MKRSALEFALELGEMELDVAHATLAGLKTVDMWRSDLWPMAEYWVKLHQQRVLFFRTRLREMEANEAAVAVAAEEPAPTYEICGGPGCGRSMLVNQFGVFVAHRPMIEGYGDTCVMSGKAPR